MSSARTQAAGSGRPTAPDTAGAPKPTRIARATRQGAAVNAVLDRTTVFRSAQDLHAQLRREGNAVGLTTVYRHLQGLAAAGEVDVLRPADGEALYRRCGDGHHHHLICRSCGRSVEVAAPEVEAWTSAVAVAHGFAEVTHTLEVFGICGDCAADRYGGPVGRAPADDLLR